MKTITKEQAVELIRNTNGKYFSVDFVKKTTGEMRHMTARLGVKKFTKGGKSTIAGKENLIGCYDQVNQGYRCINTDALKRVKVGGIEYKVEG